MEATGKPNELNQAFTDLLHSPNAGRDAGFRIAQSLVPILRLLVFLILLRPTVHIMIVVPHIASTRRAICGKCARQNVFH